jgi:hypothetical protein
MLIPHSYKLDDELQHSDAQKHEKVTQVNFQLMPLSLIEIMIYFCPGTVKFSILRVSSYAMDFL